MNFSFSNSRKLKSIYKNQNNNDEINYHRINNYIV